MVNKMLTDVVRLSQHYATVELAVEAGFTAKQQAYEFWKQQGIIIIKYHSLPFINVQRLMAWTKTIEFVKRFPIIPPPERPQTLIQALLTPPEEEKLLRKHIITLREAKQQQLQRQETVRLEKRLTEVEERLLSPIALNLIDHTALCMLDKLLWETEPTIVSQITQQLVEMCEKKTSRLHPLTGYEALQEHMLQLYVPYFMTFPFTLNMFAVRLSQLTRQALLNKSMTLYYMGATQAQAVKQKYQLMTCEKRRLETKCIASGKPVGEAIPEKFSVGWTRHLTEEEKVGLIRDMKGKELPFMALRYAYSIPYWLRRFVAIHMGYPENAKYALYFGIGGLPTRRSTWRYDFLKYPEAKYLQYSADEHIRNLIMKIQTKRGHFIKRYGKYYKRRRM